jgi:hypothetical protein
MIMAIAGIQLTQSITIPPPDYGYLFIGLRRKSRKTLWAGFEVVPMIRKNQYAYDNRSPFETVAEEVISATDFRRK